jgi:hypothetical protein
LEFQLTFDLAPRFTPGLVLVTHTKELAHVKRLCRNRKEPL